uniref:Alpha-1,3-glucosyltransferase n=1 Tax=Denticeps clupeoides TaxID=299321 RepID=A0AAY4CS61_9TELE
MEGWSLVSLCVLLGLTARWAVSLNPYSGAGKAPLFGDYEAQRHWQEVTCNLPVHQWYFNTTDNDLDYWGLDYPPLTAYHSLLCGHGDHDVLIADIFIYIPAVVSYCLYLVNGSVKKKVATMLCILLYPGLTLIDYGHFQYNGVSLGLTLLGVLGLGLGRDLLGSVAFTLALNYKQMELYHSLPFFCYLLGKCAKQGLTGRGLMQLLKISVTVLVTFALCWLPFLSDPGQLLQVVHRLFPVARGLFEDKVANAWCSLNVLIKIKTLLSTETQLSLSLVLTLLAVLPSSIKLFTRPTLWQFKLALVNSSLAFFLFSFQVHEKSILLPEHLFCSMLPLLLKDGLLLPYVVTSVAFVYYSVYLLSALERSTDEQLRLQPLHTLIPPCLPSLSFSCILKWKFAFSLVAMGGLSFASAVMEPPARLPDLFPVLVSVFSFLQFLGLLLYFNLVQLTEAAGKKNNKKTK